jgi:hypothetical protein
MKITSDILKMINKLSEAERAKVDKVVKRHVAACYRNGLPPENMDRVYIEAIELVRLEERFPEPEVVKEERNYEPFRRYEQYVSPKAA